MTLASRPTRTPERYFPAFRAADPFLDASESDARVVFDQSYLWSADRGRTVFSAGDSGDDMFIVLDGKVALAHTTPGMQPTLVEVISSGGHFGDRAAVTNESRALTATVASESALLVMVPGPVVRSWARTSPQGALTLLRCMTRRTRHATVAMTDAVQLDLPARLAKQLVGLADRFGVPTDDGIDVRHDLSQIQLAQLTGSSRETVNKTLHRFETRGWLRVGTRRVLVLDLDALARRAR